MSSQCEVLPDRTEARKKRLRATRFAKTVHLAFPPAGGLQAGRPSRRGGTCAPVITLPSKRLQLSREHAAQPLQTNCMRAAGVDSGMRAARCTTGKPLSQGRKKSAVVSSSRAAGWASNFRSAIARIRP